MTNLPYTIPSDTYKTFMKQYKIDHEVCPQCKKANYTTTLMPFSFDTDNPSSYKDGNYVECGCGWKGTVHQLIKK